MKLKIFYGILSAIIAIPFALALYFMYLSPYMDKFPIFVITMGFFSGIPIIILSIIHIFQIKKQEKKENKKNDSKTSPDIESNDNKNLLGMIKKRLAKGEISVQEFQELKKEIFS